MKYIQSYHPYEVRYALDEKVGIVLPKKTYKQSMIAAGARGVIAVTDKHLTALMGNPSFKKMLALGKNGGYEIKEEIDEAQKTANEKLAAVQEENRKLREKLGEPGARSAREVPKDITKLSLEELQALANDKGIEWLGKTEGQLRTLLAPKKGETISNRKKELGRKSNAELGLIATDLKVVTANLKRVQIIDAILDAEVKGLEEEVKVASSSKLKIMAAHFCIDIGASPDRDLTKDEAYAARAKILAGIGIAPKK